MVENIINWKQVSRMLAGNETSIRKNKRPKKYEAQIKTLESLINTWNDVHVLGKSTQISIQSVDFLDLLIKDK